MSWFLIKRNATEHEVGRLCDESQVEVLPETHWCETWRLFHMFSGS